MGIVGNLSPDQLQFFNSQGYLVIESFASEDEIEAMMKRIHQLLDHFDPSSTASIFSTKNQQKLTDDYFFESVEKVSFFFEEKAFGDDGNLKQPKQLSINKVGHALHEIEPAFKKFSSSQKISSLLYSLGYKRPVVMQSMYIFKQPGIGGEVVPHQDNSFLYTEPQTCTGLWLALEDASTINGCLWAIPGSHKNGLVRRFLRDEDGVKFDRPSPSYDKKDFVPIEVKAGSLVVIHGDLIHQSFENQSPKSRHAYSLHIVDTDGCKWAPENWIRRKVEPEPLYIHVQMLPRGPLIHSGTLAMDFHDRDDERAWVIHPGARRATYTGLVTITKGTSSGPTSRTTRYMTVEVPLPPAKLLLTYIAEMKESSTAAPLRRQGPRIIHTARKSVVRQPAPEDPPPALVVSHPDPRARERGGEGDLLEWVWV